MRTVKFPIGALFVLALSSCFNMDSYLTINGPDSVDYTVVISTPKETSFIIDAIKDSLGRFDRVETAVKNDTTYLTAEVKGIPIDSLTEFGFRVEKVDENTYRIRQESSSSDTTEQTDMMLKSILGQYRMTLTVEVKSGKVLEHNANEVKGNLYIWKTTMDRAQLFSPSITIKFQENRISPAGILLTLGLLILVIGAVILLLRRRT